MKSLLSFLAVALLPLAAAHAQYEVALQLDKTEPYVSQEPMTATVTITNRSGADVILGGPKGKAWLSFTIKDSEDHSISPLQATSDETIPFPAGERLIRKVRLSDTQAVTEPGTYAVTVSAYHPPSGEYYISNRVRFVITDIKPYGNPLTFGVPEGFDGAGRKRQYVLMVHRDMERSYLYFRLRDERTGQRLITYSLGPVTMVREPQVTLDRNNYFHVLFQARPDQSTYVIITPDGKMKSVEYFRDAQTTRAQLFLTRENQVVASGGLKFDPAQEKAEAAAAGSRVRSVGDRPPGL
jgi:hypothetical protein